MCEVDVEDVDEHVLQVQVLPSTEELLHSQLVDKVNKALLADSY